MNSYLNRKNIASLLFFMLSPILGVIYILDKIKPINLNTFYLIISAFFGLMVIKNPPLYDLIRYLEIFDAIQSYSDIVPFSNYYSFQLISYVFNLFDIPFYVLCFTYVFFILYFHLRALHLLYEKFNWSLKRQILYVLLIIIFINPIFASTILRAYLSSGLFFYGAFLLILCNKKSGIFYLISSIFFHLSFIYLLVFFVISRFLYLSKKSTFFLCILSILISSVFVRYFVDFIPYPLIVDQVNNYLNETGTGADGGVDSIQGKIITLIILLTHLSLAIFHLLSGSLKNKDYREISNFLNLMLLAGCLASISLIVFNRFFAHITMLSLFSFLVYMYLQKISFIRLFVFTSITMLNLFLIDIYIRKDSLVNGNPISMIVISPLQLISYSDQEYRKMLFIVDHKGYIKK